MKKILLPLLALLCLILPARAADFYDLPADHWAGEEIQRAVDAGAVNGYGDGSFQPAREVTAAQFCAMLSRTFLTEEYAAAKEGKYRAMEACRPVLAGTSVERTWRDLGKRWDRYVNEPLSRYDMAQIIYNLASKKDAAPGEKSAQAAVPEIGDWKEIPQDFRAAVSTCWSMGLLRGQSDGRFAGEGHLNRAQAAVIWFRLDDLFNGPYRGPEDPDAGVEVQEMPAFGLQGEETVQEMMNRINRATSLCEEGRLPNGKTRSEENIRELLDLVKEGCPEGTVWSATERYDYRAPQFSITHGPLSFALAVTDFVFGEESPVVQRRGLRDLSVGDAVYIRYEEVERVLILTGVDREEGTYTACELERNGKINWGQWGPLSGLIDAADFTTVYRRQK